ncbi:Zinc finger mym-type protein 1 [Plakobranchus ocellatus]|uniref:Zinc finger mym-type protein 1 n=1 Tax=Plakobranchus ocellatus TaxID=259542 RepID=A0AAV4AFA6_9GAST|nr:Zinc finger mym-type protein 1 [Plakobranchus ocellatus]
MACEGEELVHPLVNWHELADYFTLAEFDAQSDSKNKARLLKEVFDFSTLPHGGLPTKSIPFWEGVLQTAAFKELAEYAPTSLITPTSNANIERLCSLINATKPKARNRLATATLGAIIRIKANLCNNDECCIDFEVTPAMLEKFASSVIPHKSNTLKVLQNMDPQRDWKPMIHSFNK